MQKKAGIGTLSFILFLFSVIWQKNLLNDFCLGDKVLEALNLPAWSVYFNGMQGVHYTVFYCFAFLIVSIVIGCKHSEHLGAKIGVILSAIFLALMSFELFISLNTKLV